MVKKRTVSLIEYLLVFREHITLHQPFVQIANTVQPLAAPVAL
jgi:hypothetical protein